MNDLRPSAVFKASAFQPTFEELRDATRRQYSRPALKAPQGASSKLEVQKIEPSLYELGELSDSDDDLPDTATILKSMRLSTSKSDLKGKQKQASQDDVRAIF